MKTVDLREAILETLTMLEDRGDQTSVIEVLRLLGVTMAPTLRWGGAAESLPAPDAEGLVSLGRFQLRGELGRGGMGRVLEARDPELRRTVAVKVVIDPSKVTEVQLARFVAEAQITSQLQHPNIVPVYEMGVTSRGDIFFAMKKVEGRSLWEVLAALRAGDAATTAAFPRTKLLVAFIQICNAVAYAHDRGVLHRDLKPGNVMLGPFGEVLLMDWGVARLVGDATERISREAIEKVAVARTMDGTAIGTPGFMSPEQARGELHKLDARSDVWSLGAILYEVLTLEPAYEGASIFALTHAAMSGPPTDPRERAPKRSIPEEVAAICLQAMAAKRADRFATASELAAAVETFLEGSKRREAALGHVAEAEAAWARYRALAEEREELLAREQTLDETLAPWASLETKAELIQVRQRLDGLGRTRVDRFEEVVFASEQALSQDPGNAEAHALLAAVHYARFEEAEAARNADDQHHHEQRVRRYDADGRYADLLKGTGALTLRTDPPGAEVICERYDRAAPLAWPLVERRALGTTPLECVSLEQGSYLLTLRLPGKRDTRYPVFIPRGRHWSSGRVPVPLYSDADIGEGMTYVPPGTFVCGGDEQAAQSLPRSEPWVEGFFVSVLPVTMQGYCDFINSLSVEDPEQAWSRVPRQASRLKDSSTWGPGRSAAQYWERPAPGEPYRVPEVDRDGDRWDPMWAASAVSWDDATAYVAWRSKQDGVTWSLPTELRWEKAARGVDGRFFPWGDRFDPTLCKMRDSRPGRPVPEPVGAFPTDISPYGVRDLGGGMHDWCGDETYGGDPQRRPVRGGAWHAVARACRSADCNGYDPWIVVTNFGFRLARAAASSGLDADGVNRPRG